MKVIKLFLLITIILFFINNKAIARAPECRCNDPNRCYPDGCTRDRSKDPEVCLDNSIGPAAVQGSYLCVNSPPCCANLSCCWIEKGYCRLEQCGSTKGGCGWYWIWHDEETSKPEGYGCMQGSSPETMHPINANVITPTSAPTTPLIPTNPPVEEEPTSTSIPINPPTRVPTKPYNRTGENLDTQVERPNQNELSPLSTFQLPQINLPGLPKININIIDLNRVTRKPLSLLEFLFRKITFYDKKLEVTINGAFRKLIPSSE